MAYENTQQTALQVMTAKNPLQEQYKPLLEYLYQIIKEALMGKKLMMIMRSECILP